jgi:hypothetical protein
LFILISLPIRNFCRLSPFSDFRVLDHMSRTAMRDYTLPLKTDLITDDGGSITILTTLEA